TEDDFGFWTIVTCFENSVPPNADICDLACSLSWTPLASFARWRAGARPDHSISGHRRWCVTLALNALKHPSLDQAGFPKATASGQACLASSTIPMARVGIDPRTRTSPPTPH